MSFEKPTFSTILERVKADFRSELNVTSILRRSIEMAFVYAIAAVAYGLYGFIDFVFKMFFWDTSTGNYFLRWASIFDVEKEAATNSQYTILVTGDVGGALTAGAEYQRSDGEIYLLDDDVTIPAAVVGVSQITTIETVADVASSLNSTYFYYDTPENSYYVWFNVDAAGVDPGITSRTGVEVEIVENDTADAVATAIQTAMNDLDDVTATVLTDTVTATADTEGTCEDAVDYTSGFTITVTTPGVDEVIEGEIEATITSENTGASTVMSVGDSVSLVTPVDDVDSTAEIIAIIQDGEDEETEASHKAQFLNEIRNPPQGGAATDYINWMNAMTGVTRSWVFPLWLGMGTVGCSFVNDNDESSIFPDAAAVATVQAALVNLAPATAEVTTFAPTPVAVDMTIKLSPNTAAARTAVEAEIDDMFFREAQVAGAYRYSDEVYDGSIDRSKFTEAISIAVGEDRHELTVPAVTPTCSDGEILVKGTITWQTLI